MGEPTREQIEAVLVEHMELAAHDEFLALEQMAMEIATLRERVAALEADARRLDWLEEHAIYVTLDGRKRYRHGPIGPDRAALDAAMAEVRDA